MLKVTFFIKDVHAGKTIILLDKIAIDLAMTAVKEQKGKVARSGNKRAQAMKVLEDIIGGTFSAVELRNTFHDHGIDVRNPYGFLTALVKKKVLRKSKAGKYTVLTVKS